MAGSGDGPRGSQDIQADEISVGGHVQGRRPSRSAHQQEKLASHTLLKVIGTEVRLSPSLPRRRLAV